MSCYIGIDIGAVSASAAVIAEATGEAGVDIPGYGFVRALEGGPALYVSEYRRTRGKPIASVKFLLDEIIAAVGADTIGNVVLSGSGAETAASVLDVSVINEFRGIVSGLEVLGIEAATVFEIGGERSRYLQVRRDEDGRYSILDYSTNGDCAAGTGSFIDQQAGRLRYRIDQIGDICNSAERSAQIAGRCSVFAKSDMIHAQQKGYSPAEVMRGLCDAVAQNFRMSVVSSNPVTSPVVFLGGVTRNAAVVRAMNEVFGSDAGGPLIVPDLAERVVAAGAALHAFRDGRKGTAMNFARLQASSDFEHGAFPTNRPLSMDNVVLLREREEAFEPHGEGRIDACMGIDIGSVSTNVVVTDAEGRVIEEIYARTQGRPIEVVTGALRQIEAGWGGKLNICGVGVTGSGRELIGALVGADTVRDEITAHKTGATFVGRTLLEGRLPDTIFEIGGQDSKYISLQDGVVVDFTMNDACAAGTGSFLEERAEELDIAIKGEFAELALASRRPIRLGERCTVFMERDVNSYMQWGAEKADLVAGLAYSVVSNYINRVVRGRPIGDCIFFQGGTAYNDAVAAAFSVVTGKEIIVPPHNGMMGAIGAAILAREKMTGSNGHGRRVAGGTAFAESPLRDADSGSCFRGYDLDRVNYHLREFTCKGCSNRCRIQEFVVEGEKTYWGDKCSDRFRKRQASSRQPVIDDLMEFRLAALMDTAALPGVDQDAPQVGIPLTMFAWDYLPFFRALLAGLGFRTVLSDPTNKRIINAGVDSVVAEPCFPIITAHGHVADLIEKQVDYILMPNILSTETQWTHTESHLCPWHQTLPFVTRSAPAFSRYRRRFLAPLIPFREGFDVVFRQIRDYVLEHRSGDWPALTRKRIRRAVEKAYAAQQSFRGRVVDKGAASLAVLEEKNRPGIVLLGRPYNIYDAGMNLSVAKKLRQYYGVNCIPMEFLDTETVDIRQFNDNMFWGLGRKALAAARIVGEHPNLHIIYITNFKCGPDSFVKHFVRETSGKPFLTLQFDGHTNDAGMLTRCEAYLDSKGILHESGAAQPAGAAR